MISQCCLFPKLVGYNSFLCHPPTHFTSAGPMDAERKKGRAVLEGELAPKDAQRESKNQGDQEELMRWCDDRTKQLERGIQRQQEVVEKYEKAIQSWGDGQRCDQQDAVKQEDLHLLEEQYELLQQQLEAAQMELVQQGVKILEAGRCI